MLPGLAMILRFALYTDLMLLLGVPAFSLYTLRGDERRSGRVLPWRVWTAGLAALGVPLSAAAMLVSIATMAGVSIDAVDPTLAVEIITGSAMGWAFLARLAMCAVALFVVVAGARWQRASLATSTLCGAVALGSLAWSGHGAMDDGAVGWLHLVADIAHLLAAGVWLGALAALLWMVAGLRAPAVRALSGFATVGTIVVAIMVLTGLVNGWALLLRPGDAPLWPFNRYRWLLALKIAAFAAMLALAALNRFRFTPALAARGDRAIRISLAAEAGVAALILGLVAMLGTLSPGDQ